MKQNVLAFDFGASSGRAILGIYENGCIKLEEVHRFANEPVNILGTLYWDVMRLFYEIKQGILKAVSTVSKNGEKIDSIGIDCWGVDFGLLDENGSLLLNPIHYRDNDNVGMSKKIEEIISKEDLYKKTGIQIMDINTIFQLLKLKKKNSVALKNAKTFLMVPDLFNYFLTGEKQSEYTECSTTQLLNIKTKTWSNSLLEKIGIDKNIFTSIVPPGSNVGFLTDELQKELDVGKIPIVSVASHDTQSAIVATPSEDENFLFISCGTWALMGTHCKDYVVSEEAEKSGFSNEGGFNGGTSLLTNITGTWLIQECKRYWNSIGENVSYDDLDNEAKKATPFECFINPVSQDFVLPGKMPLRIQKWCEEHGQNIPKTKGAIIRCILESLAFTYKSSKLKIEELTGKTFDCVHIVGGGVKSSLLCEMTADACSSKVIAGPVEAAALGNIGMQLISNGTIKNLLEFRKIVKNANDIVCYESKNAKSFDEHFDRFLSII